MESADLILLAPLARAATVAVGASAGLGGDLANPPPQGDGRSSLGPAGVLRAHLDVGWGEAAVRLQGAGLAGPARDTLYWWDDGWQRSDEHWAWLGTVALGVGPALNFAPRPGLAIGVAATAGAMGVGAFHDLGGPTAYLLDPSQNDLDNPDNLDPYTLQAVPSAELVAALRLGKGLAAEVELGYTLALVPAADLSGVPPESSARRTAFALGAVFVAVGVHAPLAQGSKP